MKRISSKKATVPLLIVSIMGLLLSSCTARTLESSYTAAQILEQIVFSQQTTPDAETLTPDDAAFSSYLLQNYNLDADSVEDGAVQYAGGNSAYEVAVFRLKEGIKGETAEDELQSYIENRIGVFYGYAPEAVYHLENAVVSASGNYVALLVCDNPQQAKEAFIESVEIGRNPDHSHPDNGNTEGGDSSVTISTPSNPDVFGYDHDAILSAWESGDTSRLSEKNFAILESAKKIIGETVTEDMPEYDIELAVHDRLIEIIDYDTETLSQSVNASPTPDNDNPYGALISKRGICAGYTSTFQLLMDMLGIECLTVNGTAYDAVSEHAWNMVRLDGEWYCVDLTWNDTGSVWAEHEFFNVTSDFMSDTEHFWDAGEIPEATATKYAWKRG